MKLSMQDAFLPFLSPKGIVATVAPAPRITKCGRSQNLSFEMISDIDVILYTRCSWLAGDLVLINRQ